MGAARGIAGSTGPEEDGIFLSYEAEVDFFVGMNNTGSRVDVWAVDGIDRSELVESSDGSGFMYLPATIPPGQLTLVRTDIEPPPEEPEEDLSGSDNWSGYQPFGGHS
jgi:hypothetical protein